MRTQWDEKVAKALKKKKQETEYAAMSEDKGRHSWSAAHPAYMEPLPESALSRR